MWNSPPHLPLQVPLQNKTSFFAQALSARHKCVVDHLPHGLPARAGITAATPSPVSS